MQINSLQSATSIQHAARTAGASSAKPVQAPVPVGLPQDQLELSAEAQQLLASQAAGSPTGSDIRAERVAEIRNAIAQGTYETPEKLSVALDRLLDSLG
ncbi:MAG: flagellar biosynthesis anti-sigma factor FlgM [Pirellulaceae bacterium]|nr:flagellar biosynthesis anti-sigma factor FlgM [Pirellulaceae bacterium]